MRLFVVIIWVSKSNAKKVLKTLDEFGFSSLGLKEEDFLEPGYST